MPIINEIKQSFKQGGTLTKLIYINLAVFLVMRILYAFSSLIFHSTNFPVSDWLSVPASPTSLLYHPWTIITYMFLHIQFLHILFNMLCLYWFGQIFLQYFNQKQLLGVYFMGGISGALFYIVSYNIFPVLNEYTSSAIMMGASASVMAILFATAKYAPNYKIHLMFVGPIRLIYIALGYFLIDLLSIPTMENTGGHLAHIGGALFGIFYSTRIIKGKDVTKGFNGFMNKIISLFSRQSKMRVTYSQDKRPLNDMEYNMKKRRQQGGVDRILDKIKVSGYDSLTKQEKEDLFNASNN